MSLVAARDIAGSDDLFAGAFTLGNSLLEDLHCSAMVGKCIQVVGALAPMVRALTPLEVVHDAVASAPLEIGHGDAVASV